MCLDIDDYRALIAIPKEDISKTHLVDNYKYMYGHYDIYNFSYEGREEKEVVEQPARYLKTDKLLVSEDLLIKFGTNAGDEDIVLSS